MKKYRKHLFLAFFLSLALIARAQETSYPTKNVAGIEYYVYTIQAGEGLYSLSKKFNVTQAEINSANPEIHDGLKAGQTILIPRRTIPAAQRKRQEPEKTEYVLHKVEKKQTLFAISRIYGVSQGEIIAANPHASNGLQVGEELRIPRKKSQSAEQKAPVAPKNEPKPSATAEKPAVSAAAAPVSNLHIGKQGAYTLHTVGAKETLYSISKRYKVAMEQIVELNPEAENGLKAGSELKIPLGTNKTGETSATTAVAQKPTGKKPTPKNRYKIAYLLPFMLDDQTPDATVNKFLEFYMGALLAVRQAQNNGVNYEIYTYDTEKTESNIHAIINKPEMQEMDLIIGPAYTSQIPMLADFAKRRKIYTVIPFSSKIDDIEENPYIFQFNPDRDLQNAFLARALKSRFQAANLVLVNADSNGNSDFYNFAYNTLNNSGFSITRVSKSALGAGSIEKFLKTEKTNILIFDTDNLSSVQPYLDTLYDVSSTYNVGVIGQYAWKGEAGKKPKMYYIAPFLGDETRASNAGEYENDYSLYYGKLRGEKNPRFDMIGYDITKHFLSLMDKNGFEVNQNTKNVKITGVQSNIYFKRVGANGGFMNQQLYLIEDAAKRN